jgi:riboflavin biosynthesis pyrimidine reductase
MGLVALAEAGAPLTAADVVARLGLRERPLPGARPRVAAAMIGSLDGRAAVGGRSVGLGHPDDRALLRTLRASADVVLVGAATVRAERYAKLFDTRARPLVAIVTRSGDVPWEVGLFAEPDCRIAVYSDADMAVPAGVEAHVELRRGAAPAAVLADLGRRDGAALVHCEGGPRLLRALAAAGVLDDLVLTLAPLLVAGDAPGALAGPPLDPPLRLALAGLWRADDHLFLHYTA